MRRVHLRGRDNVLKRMLIHIGGFNLSLVMRKLLGKGTPRRLQGLSAEDLLLLLRFWVAVLACAAEESASTPRFMSSHARYRDFYSALDRMNELVLPRAASAARMEAMNCTVSSAAMRFRAQFLTTCLCGRNVWHVP